MAFWNFWHKPPSPPPLKYRVEHKANDKGLHRIYALVDIPGVCCAGETGGWVQGEHNLSHEGKGWIAEDAEVYESAVVQDDAFVHGKAQIYGSARIMNSAQVYGKAKVYGSAVVGHVAQVYNRAQVYDNAQVFNAARVYGTATVHGDAWVYRKVRVQANADVAGTAKIWGCNLGKDERIYGNETVVATDSSIQNWKIGLYD